jgi:transcriptional regulator with PAS, ATPase and Fis domain
MDCLSDPQFDELISIIKDLNLHHRNRILFTNSVEKEETLKRCERVINHLSCLTIRIPPLREHKENIPHLASLYISVLNMRFAKEIVGLEPDAMKLLQDYNWPFNYDQFKRILNELVTSVSSSYITASAVSAILCKELSDTVLNDNGKIYVNLNQSLEQINMDIIKILLNEEKNNQSNVAKKLDISRTTLWRMMQKMGLGD